MMRPKLAFAMAADKTRHVFDTATVDRLGESCEILSRQPFEDLTTDAARAALAEADILVTGWGCPMITPALLRQMPRLKLIAHAAGTVKFTVDPLAYEAGIRVTHAAEANAVPVAEYTLAAILFANKAAFTLRDRYRADPSRMTSYALMDQPIGNFRRVVGIVGASRIGRRVIKLLKPFDIAVLLHDPFAHAGDPELAGVEMVALDSLMARSDVVSVHAPLLPDTRGMIGARHLRLMRDGATFINTARGGLVDEAALVAELETGRIQGVIDVTEPEIPPPDSPLFRLPNVFLTPHVAGAIGTERSRLGILVADEVERFVRGETLLYEVMPELLERLA
ncbi:hydroxyacid dehydrogenase [Devosia sp. FJ2-5-3]|uniref:hydroxyacid dehydrogenase n=1 Tax=Devosia sp. FJ2-5-3 TaxID=2976680 RepID=UPI0023D8C7CC|nr:hydroxyacid dehydrogenase [Devosia sp. FJ2-5-3]WEJ60394.1 hydroxyacid dehydrogenase [Devosia sp. FJ2-5-3]